MQIQNEEHVQLLQSMMGDDIDADVARRVLAKHNNDIQAAASAILEGDRGEEFATVSSTWPADNAFNSSAAGGSGALNVTRPPNTPRSTPERGQPPSGRDVIDLTADHDPDLSRALQMSLEQTQQVPLLEGPAFGPSNRAPDPNWALVPSNVQTTSAQEQEDQSLSRAIEASLSTSYIEDKYEDLPDEEKIRKSGYPVALRTSSNERYFVPLVLHALFHVPQVREHLAQWRWKGNEKGLQPESDSAEYMPFTMSTLFTYMDLALFSYIQIDGLNVITNYAGRLATSAADVPGELSYELYSYLTRGIENPLRQDSSQNWDRLFHLRYAPIDSPVPTEQTQSTETNALGIENCPAIYSSLRIGSDTACVRVDLRGGPEGPNDLLSCLSSQLGLESPVILDVNTSITTINPSNLTSQPHALVAPSEVIAFELLRSSQTIGSLHSASQQNSSSSSPLVTPFRYPMHVYLDQFLLENAAPAGEKRTKKKELETRLKELTARRESLTTFEGKSTLKFLSSSQYYFENVATKGNVESRAKEVESAAESLQKIIDRINNEVQVLNTQISKLQVDIEKVFDDPALQKHRYDLRAVLVHDGLFGRSHIHSFVQYGGKWWKCQDAVVVEVSEEVVLTDTTGLHLGAGPYMLIYSRETEEIDLKSRWPTYLKNNVKKDNLDFLLGLEEIAPEAAKSLRTTYNPSPILTAEPLPDEEVEETGDREPRRSMSVMSIVDEGAESKENERMDIA